ncbi:MSHA biogenesis protein MshB [Colwellia sp. 39_35_sub15_T18]|nr:MSHA biogenesis protein MshB [Colwellia sp. 39_35_sub15_T18]
MKKQTGFTLIELVIVVVILGFLAVTAIPKFLDLTEQAKQANIEGMAGGFATGVSLARAQWESEGRPKNASNQHSVNYDGTTVYLTVEVLNSVRPGYILGTTAASTIANVNCIEVWNAIFQQPPSTSTTDLDVDSSVDYFVSKDTNNLCHYYLKASLARDTNDSTKYDDPANSTAVGNSFTYDPSNSEVIVYINDQI